MMYKILALFGFLLMLSSPILYIIGEEKVIGEQLCVDGNGNINLEGLMCEETGFFLFGFNFGDDYIIVAITLFGFTFLSLGVIGMFIEDFREGYL